MNETQPHVVLLGDSIFDNAAYTSGDPDVIAQVRAALPPGWRATLCAVDGATAVELEDQLDAVPDDATHLVISIGGNDALQNSDLLTLRVASAAAALDAFATRVSVFERVYRRAIAQALALRRYTAVCTIYNGALERDRAEAARLAVALFNDVILRTAVDLRIDALELRSICTEPGDYSNPIEPSSRGGRKIARAIAQLVGAIPARDAPARVWGLC